jgi:hypothetical protein
MIIPEIQLKELFGAFLIQSDESHQLSSIEHHLSLLLSSQLSFVSHIEIQKKMHLQMIGKPKKNIAMSLM